MDRTARIAVAVLAGSAMGAAMAAAVMRSPAIIAVAAVMAVATAVAALIGVRLPSAQRAASVRAPRTDTEGFADLSPQPEATTPDASPAQVADADQTARAEDESTPVETATPPLTEGLGSPKDIRPKRITPAESSDADAGASTSEPDAEKALAETPPPRPAEPRPGPRFPASRAPVLAAASDTVTSAALAVPSVVPASSTPVIVTATDDAPVRTVDEIRMPTSAEPDAVVTALLDAAAAAGAPVSATLWLEDPTTSTLRLVAACGTMPPEHDLEQLENSLLGSALVGGVATLRARSKIRTGQEATTIWRFAVPLKAGDARGVAAVDLVGRTEPDREVLTRAAAALRGSLTGALALHVAREERAAATTLVETARDLSRLLDPDQVIEAALERAMQLSRAQTGSIMLLDDSGALRIAAAKGLPEDVVSETSLSEGEGIAGWVLASGQPVVVEDLDGRGPQSRRHGVRSAVSVPLADQDGVLGVLNVGSRRFHARFSRSHLEALETLGRITALALRNARAAQHAVDMYFDTLRALALAMETKDPYSQGGTDRVVDITGLLADELGLPPKDREALRIASLLHDVGMSAAGEAVVTRDRPLSTVEWSMLKMHPIIAAEVLEQAPALRDVVPIVYHHHEHYDGTGYVAGVSADSIPIGARVLAVADAFVAMTSDRPYRAAMSVSEALSELRSKAGKQFDPEVVAALDALAGRGALPSHSR